MIKGNIISLILMITYLEVYLVDVFENDSKIISHILSVQVVVRVL